MNDEHEAIRRRSSLIVHRSSFLLALLFFLAVPARALDIPPPPATYVTDAAKILSEPDAHALNEKLAAFEQRSGAQFIIYTFPTLDNEALEDFTIRCAEKWKVGNKKYDNGLILFVFIKERKLRIEVGYGLERTITDAISSRVIRQYIAPKFQAGDYAGGLNAAADALIAEIEHKEAPVPPVSRPGSTATGGSLFTLILVIFVIIFIASIVTRSRPGCGGCFWPMFFLGGGGGSSFGGGGSGGGGGGWSGFGGGGGSFGGGGASGGW